MTERWIGTRYAWGGGSLTGPSEGVDIDAGVIGFDCSGLTRYAYARAGINIPRNSTAQYSALPKVSYNNLQAGDLVFWGSDPSDPETADLMDRVDRGAKGEEVFSERLSILFKRLRIVRMVDKARNTLVYLTYSDRIIEGSPQNSVTAPAGVLRQRAGEPGFT